MNITQHVMLSKSQENLQAAQLAFDNELYNVVANRAYYACYQIACVALDFFKNEIYPIDNVREHNHKSVIGGFGRYLIKEDQKIPKELSSYLKRLSIDRETADYEPNTPINRDTAEKILKDATYFIKVVDDSMK